MAKIEIKRVGDLDELLIPGDGAKWGVSDWYEDVRAAIQECLNKGPKYCWSTGWYGVKKELQSAKITCPGDGTIQIHTSCSDDFDTEGNGHRTIPHTTDVDALAEAMDGASDEADEDLKDNAQYLGFSVMKRADGKRKRRGWTCVDYFLMPAGSYGWNDPVPGDNYSEWGLQSPELVPTKLHNRIRQSAERFANGVYKREWASIARGWKLSPWR